MSNKYENIISKIWLSENQTKIYLDLLNNWSSNIVEISRRISIHRPIIYKTIPSLVEIWLISEVLKWKRKNYKAESPENLKSIFENLSNNFSNIIEELWEIYNQSSDKPIFKILNWINWIKSVFLDVVNTLDYEWTFYRYTSSANFNRKYLPNKYRELRNDKKIRRVVITSEDWEYSKKRNKPEREVVRMPKNFWLLDDNIAKIIYKNKIAIIDYNSLTSIIIESEIFAKFELRIFKTLVKLLKEF